MHLTRRDLVVAFVALVVAGFAAGVTAGVSIAARQASPERLPHSTTFDWSTFRVNTNEFGSQRPIVRAGTPTLDELEMHFTTLLPGRNSHEPHRHFNEELVIMKEGELETLSNGVWKKVGTGSVIYNASCELHGVRNIGTGPASYHVVNWSAPGQLGRTCPETK